jgi:radical SAM protein with 4Fe4S-binding SPASM domain
MKPLYFDKPIVDAAYFITSKQCNLRCKYCYEKHGTKRMTKDVAFAGVDFLFRNSIRSNHSINITFFGGEPTLEPELITSTIRYAIDKGKEYNKNVTFGMVTNCVNLPDEIRDIILEVGKQYHFNIQLSIDGPEDIQDAYRVFPDGSGSWYRVTDTMEKWKRLFTEVNYGMIGIHGCFNKVTLPRLFDSYLYFRETRGFKKIWHIPVSEEKWSDEDVLIYKEQLINIKNYIIDRCISEHSYQELSHYSPLCRCLEDRGIRGKPCGAGMNFVSITPEGDITPCHQMYFNIPQSNIGDVWYGIDEDRRRLFVEYDDNDLPCTERDCPHTSCFRCIAHNYDERGCMFSIHSQQFCKMMMVDYEIQEELKKFYEVDEHGINK